MVVSTGATSAIALVVLILINAVANGSVIALARDATQRRCEADARRAATRSRNRSSREDAPTTRPPVAAQPSKSSQPPVATGLVKLPRWSADDAIDAEIVSEELYS